MFCRHCGQQLDDQAVICVRCGRTPQNGVYFCWYCGAQTNPIAQVCTNCGVAMQSANQSQAGNKSKLTAGLLGIFLGGFGFHNFYLGYTNKAIIQLVLGLIGFFGSCSQFFFYGFGYYGFGNPWGFTLWISSVWGFIEGIMILSGSINTDGQGYRLRD
jgi:TM2 domain-containing membrane protein YozV